MKFKNDISIALIIEKKINIHNIARTFHSTIESLNYAKKFDISGEIIITVDKTDIYSKNYLQKLCSENSDSSISIVEVNDNNDINNILSYVSGKYIALTTTGFLSSQNWIYKAFEHLKNTSDKVVVHPEYQLKYDETSNSMFRQLTKTDKSFKFNNYAFYNPQKFVCMATNETMQDFLNDNEVIHYTIPDSICFSKTFKNANLKHSILYEKSDKQRFLDLCQGKRVFLYGAGIATESKLKQVDTSQLNIHGIIDRDKNKAGKIIVGYEVFPLEEIEKLNPDIIILTVAKWTSVFLSVTNCLMEKNIKAIIIPDFLQELNQKTSTNSFSKEILNQLKLIHTIDPANSLRNFSAPLLNIPITACDDNYKLLNKLCGEQNIDYLFMVPWLTTGGADLVVLNYINAIKFINPDKNIIVMTTQNKESLWKDRIPKGIKFIEIDKTFKHLSHNARKELLVNFISNRCPNVIHNINSEICYSIFVEYGEQISKKSKLFISTFSPNYTENNEMLGYQISSLPYCFEYLTKVFSDNQNIINLLCRMYGFEREKFQVHYNPIEIQEKKKYTNKVLQKKHMDILWAGRLDTPKRPDILAKIAQKYLEKSYTFHVYGGAILNKDIYTKELVKLNNIKCYGHYNDFNSIDKSNIDIFLNTSQWDGVPNILLEVMSSGIPVLTSNAGGISELVKHKQNGFLVTQYDDVDQYVSILDEIFNNKFNLENIVENAYNTLKSQHSWNNFIKTIKKEDLYIC